RPSVNTATTCIHVRSSPRHHLTRSRNKARENRKPSAANTRVPMAGESAPHLQSAKRDVEQERGRGAEVGVELPLVQAEVVQSRVAEWLVRDGVVGVAQVQQLRWRLDLQAELVREERVGNRVLEVAEDGSRSGASGFPYDTAARA